MKQKFEALSYQAGSYETIKVFKREKEAIDFANKHADLILRTVTPDGRKQVWNDYSEKWEESEHE